MCGINGIAAELKGLGSRSWSQIVLPHVMAANENSRIEALAS